MLFRSREDFEQSHLPDRLVDLRVSHRSDHGDRLAARFLDKDAHLRMRHQPVHLEQLGQLLFQLEGRQPAGPDFDREQRERDVARFADAQIARELGHIEDFDVHQIAAADEVLALAGLRGRGELADSFVRFLWCFQLLLRESCRSEERRVGKECRL